MVQNKQAEETFVQKVVVQVGPTVHDTLFSGDGPASAVVYRGQSSNDSLDVDSLDGERLE